MKYLLPMIPTLVAFGPVFMVMGSRAGDLYWTAYIGGLMLSLGVLALFGIVARQAQEIRALKEGRAATIPGPLGRAHGRQAEEP